MSAPLLFAGDRGDGTTESRTVLSTACNALLPFLTLKDATAFSSTCVEARKTVADFPFDDLRPWIPGKVSAWRAVFPRARSVSLRFKADLKDSDFALLSNLRTLDLYGAELNATTASSSFRHLKSVTTLDVSHCPTLRGAAFVHFTRLTKLTMAWCRQPTITDAVFVHLKSCTDLDMTLCWQKAITDEGLRTLIGHGVLKKLAMGGLTQSYITDEGVAAVLDRNILEELDVSGCMQLTDAAFRSTLERKGALTLRVLDVSFCNRIAPETLDALRERGVTIVKRRSEREAGPRAPAPAEAD